MHDRLMKSVGIWLCVFLLSACVSCRPRSRSTQSEDPPTQTYVSPFPPPPPVPTEFHESVSIANFAGEQLDECDDFEITMPLPPDAGADWKPKKDVASTLMGKKAGKTATRISKRCGEQFSDRVRLSGCAYEIRGDGGTGHAELSSNFYNFETASSDAFMKECMLAGGNWTSLAKDSFEYRHAKHEHDFAKIQKQLGN